MARVLLTVSDSASVVDKLLQVQLPGGRTSCLQLQIFRQANSTIVILTEPYLCREHPIPRIIDTLATRILRDYQLDLDTTLWVEHQIEEEGTEQPQQKILRHVYYLVQCNWSGGQFSEPRYCELTQGQVDGLVGLPMPHVTQFPYDFDSYETGPVGAPGRIQEPQY